MRFSFSFRPSLEVVVFILHHLALALIPAEKETKKKKEKFSVFDSGTLLSVVTYHRKSLHYLTVN